MMLRTRSMHQRDLPFDEMGKHFELGDWKLLYILGGFLISNHLNLIDNWIWCSLVLIAYLGDCDLGDWIGLKSNDLKRWSRQSFTKSNSLLRGFKIRNAPRNPWFKVICLVSGMLSTTKICTPFKILHFVAVCLQVCDIFLSHKCPAFIFMSVYFFYIVKRGCCVMNEGSFHVLYVC